MQPVLGGGDDAGLVRAAERERVRTAGGCRTVRGRRTPGSERAGRQTGGRDTATDQTAARDRVLGQDSTAAVSRDSGSASALTAFARAWISSWVRSS